MSDNLIIKPPLYMVGCKVGCWNCNVKFPVISIIATSIYDGGCNGGGASCVLTNITDLPVELLNYIQSRVPTFKFQYSKTLKKEYFANVCPNCGCMMGDFFLHSEPGAVFFPEDEKQASTLHITPIPITDPMTISSGYGYGITEMILENAKRI